MAPKKKSLTASSSDSTTSSAVVSKRPRNIEFGLPIEGKKKKKQKNKIGF